jgi:acetyl-CoA synthetase
MSTSTDGKGQETGVIQSVSRESRLFPPPASFTARARLNDPIAYQRLYRQSIDDPDAFLAEMGRSELAWTRPFQKVRTGTVPW